jgi:hypothetical protein
MAMFPAMRQQLSQIGGQTGAPLFNRNVEPQGVEHEPEQIVRPANLVHVARHGGVVISN